MRGYHDFMSVLPSNTYGNFYHKYLIDTRRSVIRRHKELKKIAKYGTAKEFYRALKVWQDAVDNYKRVKNDTNEIDRTRQTSWVVQFQPCGFGNSANKSQ